MRAAASTPKAAILAIVENVRSCSSQGSDLRELFSVLETRVNSSFEDVVRRVGTTMRDFLQNTAFYPQDQSNQFWIDVQSRYGTGPGFRADVLSMYADQMEDYEKVLERKAEAIWGTLLIEPILKYLG